MELTGRIVKILEPKTGESKSGTWTTQDFVIETESQHAKTVCFNVWKDKVDLSKFRIGDMVTVRFDVQSKEYNGKWFTNCNAWGILATGSKVESAQSIIDSQVPFDAKAQDDLPF